MKTPSSDLPAPVITLIAMQASPSPAADDGRSQSLQKAWLVFGSLTFLLALFLAVVAVIMLDRRRRRNRGTNKPAAAPGVDAWSEAGRRARGD